MNTFKCFVCKQTKTNDSTLTTGYGLDNNRKKICYSCCADKDKEQMDDTGRIALYLTRKDEQRVVTNWPGTLSFSICEARLGLHNLAKKRTDVWFFDHNGDKWHGVSYGDFTQLCHCKKINDGTQKFFNSMFNKAA